MHDHYFTPLPQSERKPARWTFSYRGKELVFDTDSGVFSRLAMDKGSEYLLRALPETMAGAVLDMGCGYGAIGLCVAKAYPGCFVTLADVNQRAVALAAANGKQNGLRVKTIVSDGFSGLEGAVFDFILLNPPIRAGKQVVYRMFTDAARHLVPGGELWLVIRKQQGAPSAMAYLKERFSQVLAADKKGGYWVLRCLGPKLSEGDESHGL